MSDDKQNQLRLSFHLVFDNADGRAVLAELVEFTRAEEAEYCADARKESYMQGRRSVLLHIQKLLK